MPSATSASASSEGSMVNLHFAHEVVVPVQLLAHDLVGRLVMVLFKEVKSADILQQSVGNLRETIISTVLVITVASLCCVQLSTMSDNGDMTEHTHTHTTQPLPTGRAGFSHVCSCT